MGVPGGFFEVTGKMEELDRIMDGIYENSGRMTSDESFTLDLWLEMKDEWFSLYDSGVRADFADELTRKGVHTFDIHSIRKYAKGER